MKVKLLNPVSLTLIKHGAEYPKIFKRGDTVEVDEWTAKQLRDMRYIK